MSLELIHSAEDEFDLRSHRIICFLGSCCFQLLGIATQSRHFPAQPEQFSCIEIQAFVVIPQTVNLIGSCGKLVLKPLVFFCQRRLLLLERLDLVA